MNPAWRVDFYGTVSPDDVGAALSEALAA